MLSPMYEEWEIGLYLIGINNYYIDNQLFKFVDKSYI